MSISSCCEERAEFLSEKLITAPICKLALEGAEYQGDKIHNGCADFLRDSAHASSGKGHADFPQKHPNIETSPNLEDSVLADTAKSEIKEAIYLWLKE